MDLEGFEPSPNPLMGYRATVTPRAHAKSLSQRGAFTMARCENLSVESFVPGISCESCHGPGKKHPARYASTPSASEIPPPGPNAETAIVNPAKLDAARRDSVCISCHLEGDVSVEKAGHSGLDYRPGDRISTYLAYVYYGHPRLVLKRAAN